MAASEKEAHLKATAAALKLQSRQTEKQYKQLQDKERKRQARKQKQAGVVCRAVFLMTCGVSEIPIKQCCLEFGLDLDTTREKILKDMSEEDDQTLEEELHGLIFGNNGFAQGVRRRVLDSAVVSDIDDLNTSSGYAPSYSDIITIRRYTYEKFFHHAPPLHPTDKMASQWCRRFVRRKKLKRGRIERHQHESRLQLLRQVRPG